MVRDLMEKLNLFYTRVLVVIIIQYWFYSCFFGETIFLFDNYFVIECKALYEINIIFESALVSIYFFDYLLLYKDDASHTNYHFLSLNLILKLKF